jgi:hypothetical protein
MRARKGSGGAKPPSQKTMLKNNDTEAMARYALHGLQAK